jgi:YidC/Oxa1 family membrane protein insertase
MDRKGIIAVVISVLVLLIWQFEFAPKYAPPVSPTVAAGSPAPGASPGASPGAVAASSAAPSIAPAMSPSASATTPEENVPEHITDATGPAAQYHFTNLGGGITRAVLTDYLAESGSHVTLNEFGTFPIGAISEKPDEGADLPYTVTAQGGNTILCVRDQPGGLSIAKKFTLPVSTKDARGFEFTMDVSFTNKGTQAIQSPGYYVYIGSAAPIHQKDLPMYTAFDWYVQGGKSTDTNVNYFNAGKIPFLGIETRPERPVYTADADNIGWAAVNSQYFTTIFAPQNGAAGNGVWAHRFPVTTDTRQVQAIEGALRMPAFTLAPGQSVTNTYSVYAGPKIYGVLKDLGDGQQRILNFGMFSYVSIFLLSTMNWLHGWMGSYALAIIVLTLFIRGILWPIQNRATASMRQMQEIQPRMAELKEKYKDDPARMNTEVMKLYKEYNINPLAGCLPMFIQLPVFAGFYRMLGTAIELRDSKFLWVHDLSQPDTLFHIAGLPVNILPLCSAATMFLQMSMQPKSGDKAQQQMFIFMPLIFVVICYNFASALALYMTIGNIFSIIQLYVTRTRTAPAPLKLQTKRKTR